MRSGIRRAMERLRLRIDVLRRRPVYPGDKNRWDYQRPLFDFNIRAGDLVLDAGCGNDPFPLATHLIDLHVEPTPHRHESLHRDGRPFGIGDICALPFTDKSFAFVYSAHVLEHVADPILACAEIMRVGRRGFIETPAFAKDALFGWASGMHRWHVVAIANHLVFFEYSPRQLQGVRSSQWTDAILGRFKHPMQELFYSNQDVFNTMLLWNDSFQVHVFRLDGEVSIFPDPHSQPVKPA